MKHINLTHDDQKKAFDDGRDGRDGHSLEEYKPVVSMDGAIRCSCGRQLVKMDETRWRCAAGWPIYDLSHGDIIKGKDGELWMRGLPHNNPEEGNHGEG